MKTILRIDAVSQSANAACTKAADRWVAMQSDAQILHRDLSTTPSPRVDRNWRLASQSIKSQRGPEQVALLAHSDILLAEIAASDVVVIVAELTYAGLSAPLRGWIEQISRYPHHASCERPTPPKVVLALGIRSGEGEVAQSEVQVLRHALGAIGLTDVFIMAEEEPCQGNMVEKAACALGG